MLFNVIYRILSENVLQAYSAVIEAPKDFSFPNDNALNELKGYIRKLRHTTHKTDLTNDNIKIERILRIAELGMMPAVFGTPNHPDYPDLMPTPNNTVRMEKGSIEWLMEFIETHLDAAQAARAGNLDYREGFLACKKLALELLREFIR